MIEAQQHQGGIDPYFVLGVNPKCKKADLRAAYTKQLQLLDEDNFLSSPQGWVQAQQAYVALESAYKSIVEDDDANSNELPEDDINELHPKLGQLLVAQGIITLEQLKDAIACQQELRVPLGEILKKSMLITQNELDAFLLNQRLIKLPPDSPYLFGRRLMGLGLITQDMLMVALLEQRATGKSLGEILVERGWLDEEILHILDSTLLDLD